MLASVDGDSVVCMQPPISKAVARDRPNFSLESILNDVFMM